MSFQDVMEKYKRLSPESKQQVDELIERLNTKKQDVPDEAIPLFGILRGKIKMAPDFDEPLDDFKEYM